MGRYQLAEVTANVVVDIANQLRDSLLKSNASALKDAAIAYDVLDPQDDDAS